MTDSGRKARVSPEREHWSPAIRERAQSIYNEPSSPTAAEVARRLNLEQQSLGGAVPSQSTVRDWVRKGWLTRNADSEQWSIRDSSPEDALLILPVVKFLVEQTNDPSRRPSRAVAGWIVKVGRISTGMGRALEPAPLLMWAFSAHVAETNHDHERLRQVEAFLAGIDEDIADRKVQPE